jgi:hypothetical protein
LDDDDKHEFHQINELVKIKHGILSSNFTSNRQNECGRTERNINFSKKYLHVRIKERFIAGALKKAYRDFGGIFFVNNFPSLK